MRKTAVAVFVVALTAFIVLAGIPFLTHKREFPASITLPAARNVLALDQVPGGAKLCMNQVTIEPRSALARFRAGTYGKPGTPLTVTLVGPSYRFTKRIAAGWFDNALQQIAVPHPRTAQLLRVCIANQGKTRIAVYGADEMARRPIATVNGKAVTAAPAFGFWEAGTHSIADHAGVTVQRMTAFRSFLGHEWIVWTLIVLGLLALVVGTPLALWLSDD